MARKPLASGICWLLGMPLNICLLIAAKQTGMPSCVCHLALIPSITVPNAIMCVVEMQEDIRCIVMGSQLISF